MKYLNDKSALLLLKLLLCADLTFIVLHIINGRTPFLNSDNFDIGRDLAYPEIYQYIKYIGIIILLAYVSKVTKSFGYASWALLFTYFLCDDSLRIHEIAGSHIATNLNFTPPFNLRLQDIGELAVSTIVGMPLLSFIAWNYLHGSYAFKRETEDMLLLIFALVFCGVFVDMAHSAINMGKYVSFLLGIVEDGGEMVVVSLILWYVFLLSKRKGIANFYLCNLLRKAPRL